MLCCNALLHWMVAAVLSVSIASARSYYVSTTGNNANPGTLDLPFQTIQQAASTAVPGDTVYVRTGVYRETVTPARSGTQAAPVTFQPYNNESVTISGAEVIPASSWSLSSGNIYKAPIAWDLGEGNNQIFLDGQMMIEARWPNTTLDVSRPIVAVTGAGSHVEVGPGPSGSITSNGVITGLELPSRPAGYWIGSTIHISLFDYKGYQGPGWTWQTGSVSSSSAGQLSFSWSKWVVAQNGIIPGPKNPYYLTGKLSELDGAGEWFLDSVPSTLHFSTPGGDNPAQHMVEAKRRQFAFDLRGRSFVTVQGFNVFAATISTGVLSEHVVLDGLKAQYVSHYSLVPNAGISFLGINDSGIVLNGKNNVLRNSSIAFSAGNGVLVVGSGHRVFNNVIRDANYYANEASPVAAGFNQATNGFLIGWNTIYNAGRHGILLTNRNLDSGDKGRVLHNEIYNYGLQTSDLGCVYAWNTDGKGTEIAHNLCHDGSSLPLVEGVYVDFDSSHYLVHHNVVWAASSSVVLNSGSNNNKVYNNTFASARGLRASLGLDGLSRQLDTEVKNNIFTGPMNPTPLIAFQNNINSGTDPQFVNPALGDFQLKSTSPAINAGVVIAPYTDGFTGTAPDAGAYEFGRPTWKAGGGQAIVTQLSSAASYGTALAPASIAVAFGPRLATGSGDSSSTSLPTSLAGTTVKITDGAGVDHLAQLLYVRPAQLAFLMPAATAPGVALITVTSGDGTISLGSAPVFSTAAGIFTANANGSGVAAASLVRIKADGSQSVETVLTFDTIQNQFVPLPIDRGAPTDQLILVLYGTGIRNHGISSSAVLAQVGGTNVQVQYAGSQNEFPGLDQVNIALPRSLPSGLANIVLIVDGQPANTVTIAMR